MVLWTVLPEEIVLEDLGDIPSYEELDVGGVLLMAERLSPRQCRIVRLLTTEPADYLRPDIQPGTIVNFRAETTAG